MNKSRPAGLEDRPTFVAGFVIGALSKFHIDFKTIQCKCPLPNQNGLALSTTYLIDIVAHNSVSFIAHWAILTLVTAISETDAIHTVKTRT